MAWFLRIIACWFLIHRKYKFLLHFLCLMLLCGVGVQVETVHFLKSGGGVIIGVGNDLVPEWYLLRIISNASSFFLIIPSLPISSSVDGGERSYGWTPEQLEHRRTQPCATAHHATTPRHPPGLLAWVRKNQGMPDFSPKAEFRRKCMLKFWNFKSSRNVQKPKASNKGSWNGVRIKRFQKDKIFLEFRENSGFLSFSPYLISTIMS